MDKNQPFFDPYNFNMQNISHMQGVVPPQQDIPQPVDSMQNVVSPTMYYEQQYMYYRYLTQMLEYRIKLREYDSSTRNDKKQ